MSMVDPVSISEAARTLDLSLARVRAMAVRGQLPAAKLGDRWFVERAAVERRLRDGAPGGRRFSPRNAWALILLASGEELEGIDPSVRSRLKRSLGWQGLKKLGPRLGLRAKSQWFMAHPGEIAYVLNDPAFARSGVSAAGEQGFDLLPGREADGYLGADELDAFGARHALEPAGIEGNVRLRIVPKEAQGILAGREAAPPAAVALDLSEDFDPRSALAGRSALGELDQLWLNG
jgi:hypothetical protein